MAGPAKGNFAKGARCQPSSAETEASFHMTWSPPGNELHLHLHHFDFRR